MTTRERKLLRQRTADYLQRRILRLEARGTVTIPSWTIRKASAKLKKVLPDADELAREAASDSIHSCGWRSIPASARVGIYYRKPEAAKIRDWLEAEVQNLYLKALAMAQGLKS